MGSDEMIQFEENKYDELCEKFIEQNRDAWEKFVAEEYTEWHAGSIDHAKDTKAEEEIARKEGLL